MKEPPIVVSLLLAVIVTLAVALVVFPAIAWLCPLEDCSEYSLIAQRETLLHCCLHGHQM